MTSRSKGFLLATNERKSLIKVYFLSFSKKIYVKLDFADKYARESTLYTLMQRRATLFGSRDILEIFFVDAGQYINYNLEWITLSIKTEN